MSFATTFYNLRTARKLSQYEIATMLGTSQASITAWERGVRVPSRKMMNKIAEAFNLPLSSLMSDDQLQSRDQVSILADTLHANPKLGLLFDRTKNLSDKDLDAILGIVAAITKEQYEDGEDE